jgi:hypothetical protein
MPLSRSHCCLFLVTLVACSSGDRQGPAAEWAAPAITAAGVPVGDLITDYVLPEGRAVHAIDASLSLYFQRGAVDDTVEIGVQVITSTAPGGLRSIRLTPASLSFSDRVTVELDPISDSLTLTGRTIAMRLDDGRWQLVDPTSVEETGGGRLRFDIQHFGDIALLDFVRVRPAVDSVSEGGSLILTAEYCNTVAHLTSETLAAFAATCNQLPRPAAGEDDPAFTSLRLDPASWTVNGVPGGAVDRGTVSSGLTATYTAPDNLTVANPLSVSLTARGTGATQVLTTFLYIVAGTNVAP